MSDRDERIEDYADDYLPSELAEWLVDAEDEIEMWKARVARLEAQDAKCCGNYRD